MLDKLATGGMAEVYKAKMVGIGGFEKLCVIKTILADLASDSEFIKMFFDEANIASKLNHPNIVQLFDLGKEGDTFFIAMEYLDGLDIANIIYKSALKGKPVELKCACKIISNVCEGLDYAHKKTDEGSRKLNIIHRDISPANILVTYEGGVKLVDFGIAKASGKSSRTKVGIIKGKASYMSPEQLKTPDIDWRTDLFSLGVLFYQMVVGKKPFEAPNKNLLYQAILQKNPRLPSKVNPEIPAEVDAIVMKCLEKDRKNRYQSARDIHQDIEKFLNKRNMNVTTYDLGIYVRHLAGKEEPANEPGESAPIQKDTQNIRILTPIPADLGKESLVFKLKEKEPIFQSQIAPEKKKVLPEYKSREEASNRSISPTPDDAKQTVEIAKDKYLSAQFPHNPFEENAKTIRSDSLFEGQNVKVTNPYKIDIGIGDRLNPFEMMAETVIQSPGIQSYVQAASGKKDRIRFDAKKMVGYVGNSGEAPPEKSGKEAVSERSPVSPAGVSIRETTPLNMKQPIIVDTVEKSIVSQGKKSRTTLTLIIIIGFLVLLISGLIIWLVHGSTRYAVLEIISTPPGATVLVNNKELTEKTPLVLNNLVVGNRYHVVVAKKGFKRVEKWVELKKKQSNLIKAELQDQDK